MVNLFSGLFQVGEGKVKLALSMTNTQTKANF